jgi:predicted transcriptional regulator
MSTAIVDIRQQAKLRLSELQPYLDEADQLRSILAAIEGRSPEFEATARRVRPSTASRAPMGANKRRILAAVLERPGVTAADVARQTGLKRTVVASTMSRLKRTGELEQHGRGARVPAHLEAETRALLDI